MSRTFPLFVILAVLTVVVCGLDIARHAIDEHTTARVNSERAERLEREDKAMVIACAAGKTSTIFYKGVYCNGR